MSEDAPAARPPAADAGAGRAPVGTLVVFSDDWGRHPSSCQHLVRVLLADYRVEWINTIGTRRPGLDRYSVVRAAQKLAGWIRPDGGSDEPGDAVRPSVTAPIMWPSFRSAAGRRLNRALLERAVSARIDDPGSTACVTTLPIVADLVGRLQVARWVYYCVDDLARWPGLDRTSLERMERRLVDAVDEVVVVSERLMERIAAMGRSATLLTHGVDLEAWRLPEVSSLPAASALESPTVLFWGVVDRRLDLDLLGALAARPDLGSLVLLGPDNNPAAELDSIEGVVRPGAVPFESLPAWAARAAVLVMPYADLPATRAIQPLKLKEYLATGRPVVTTPLPAVDEWRDCCDVEATAETFAARVAERALGGLPAPQAEARQRLAAESWTRKARRLERVLTGEAR